MNELKHEVFFEPGHDCIRFECKFDSKTCLPRSGGSHGRHGINIRFVAMGDKGAVQFLLYTNWTPQFSEKQEQWQVTELEFNARTAADYPMPVDLGYHSLERQYPDQPGHENCPYVGGKTCYYDGSGLNANDAMYTLCNGGLEALWKFLDEYYLCVFEDGTYPQKAEYPKPLRK